LIRWLREHGVRAHFVSVRWERDSTDSALTFLYGQLRLRVVQRLAEAAPIYVGGARRAIVDALGSGESVYGLVDVPVRGASVQHGNCVMFGRPMLLPTGLLDAAASTPAAALILTSHVRPDGSRIVDAEVVEHAADVTIDRLARELQKRIEADSAMWHFWYLWGALSARAAA
jgi:hypothetical protein